jgi:hypothetical protein
MRERGSSPSAPADADQVIWLDPAQVDTNRSLKELMRDGKVWIISPKGSDEQSRIKEMLASSGPCREST